MNDLNVKKNNNLIDISIGKNFFAPKCKDRNENFDKRNSHAIYYDVCNFKCLFCNHGLKLSSKHHYMKLKEFEEKVIELLNSSIMFKFTGGEPCMNTHLEDMLKIVKNHNGIVFLDTNGSYTDKIKLLIDKNLIDVLGISLKGLNKDEAVKTSGIKNEKLCWDNALETIKYASQKKNIRTIITYVAYNDFNYKNIVQLSKILDNYGKNIFLKINNLCGSLHRDNTLKPLDVNKLNEMIEKFEIENPKWKGRIILIESSEGVTQYSSIKFL